MEWIVLCIFSFACNLAKTAPPITKRATKEQNVQGIVSRFIKTSKGWGSFYGKYSYGTGACSLDPMPPVYNQKGWIKVTAGEHNFKKSLGCGMCLRIEASGKPKVRGTTPMEGTYYAVISDLCDTCGQDDLGFYIEGNGKWEISFDAIDCPDVSGSDGNIQYRLTGSTPWYLKLQITNAKLPTAAVEFYKDGKWHCAKRTDDNHFVWSGVGEINFPLRTRLTSIAGETVGGNIPKLLNDKDQNSGFQYKKFLEGSHASDGNPDDVTRQDEEEINGGLKRGNDKKPETGDGEETAEIKMYCMSRPSGVYADPTDCHFFTICANLKFRQKCPSGLHWNDKVKACDLPSKAGCSKTINGYKSTQSFTVIEKEKKQILSRCPEIINGAGRYFYPYDCSKFILCNGGLANTYRCPDGYLFDMFRKRCRKGEYVRCGTRASPFQGSKDSIEGPNSRSSADKLGFSTDRLIESDKPKIDRNFCFGKMDGFYKIENECQGFYKCSRGLTYIKKCPNGLLFNAAEEICDWPRHVLC